MKTIKINDYYTMKNIELLHQAIQTAANPEVEQLIKRFILSNDLQVKSKFNLFDCVNKKADYRPATSGVHYENGFAYATEGHIAIKLKQDYATDLEGKTINKKGEELKDPYPNVDSVIPCDAKLTFIPFDFAKVLELEKVYKLDCKADPKIKTGLIKVNEAYLSISLLAKIARFALHFGIDTIGIENRVRALKITDGDNIAILMPVSYDEASKHQKVYDL